SAGESRPLAVASASPEELRMRIERVLGLGLLLLCGAAAARADDWPQWMGPKRDAVWREQGVLAKFPAGGPKKRWRVKVVEGYSGPAVAGGKGYGTHRVLS